MRYIYIVLWEKAGILVQQEEKSCDGRAVLTVGWCELHGVHHVSCSK